MTIAAYRGVCPVCRHDHSRLDDVRRKVREVPGYYEGGVNHDLARAIIAQRAQRAIHERAREAVTALVQAGDELCKAARDLREMQPADQGALLAARIDRIANAERGMGQAMALVRRGLLPQNAGANRR